MSILDGESPLLHHPDALRSEDRVWLEAIGYCIAIAEVTYARLTALLFDLARVPGAFDSRATPLAMADAWSLVDAAHRLGKLLKAKPRPPRGGSTPTLKTAPGARFKDTCNAFFAKQESVIEVRNDVQHLDSHMPKLSATGDPVWGSLSWFVASETGAGGTIHSLHAGGGREYELHLTNPLGRHVALGQIAFVDLSVRGTTVCLSERHGSMLDVGAHLERILRPQFQNQARTITGGLVSVELAWDEDGDNPAD